MKMIYTIKEVAKMTNYSERHIRALVRGGKINAVKPNNGKIFVKREDIVKFLNK